MARGAARIFIGAGETGSHLSHVKSSIAENWRAASSNVGFAYGGIERPAAGAAAGAAAAAAADAYGVSPFAANAVPSAA